MLQDPAMEALFNSNLVKVLQMVHHQDILSV